MGIVQGMFLNHKGIKLKIKNKHKFHTHFYWTKNIFNMKQYYISSNSMGRIYARDMLHMFL